MNHCQEQARAAYKKKDYTKALELFDRAIGLSPSVQLLDNRAACYEKLDDLPAALKDAKKAIQLGKPDPTGYLRAGRILRRMEKKSVALEIYAYGSKCVKPVGQGYELLRKSHRDLMSELSPPTSVDPLSLLPRELAEEVLKYLTFKQLMNTCLVSKQWAQFIRSTPNLWRHLDLRHARKRKVKNTFISRAINIGRNKLEAATLNMLFDFDKTLAALLRHCPVKDLTLVNTGLQSDNLVELLKKAKVLRSLCIENGTILGQSTLSAIMNSTASTLEALRCDDLLVESPLGVLRLESDFSQMQRLELGWSREWTSLNRLVDVIAKFPNLCYLRLHQLKSCPFTQLARFDLSGHSKLQHLDLWLNFDDATCFKPPTSTKSLAFGSWRNCPDFFGSVIFDWVLPNLEDLTLSVNLLPFESIVNVLEGQTLAPEEDQPGAMSPREARRLHSLSLAKCLLPDNPERVRAAEMVWKHTRLSSLEHLGLEESIGCDDKIVDIVAQCLPGLRSINISSTVVTGVGIKTVIQKTRVKKLVANNCQSISLDAIEWARQQGVQVERKLNDGLSGGKKVRQ